MGVAHTTAAHQTKKQKETLTSSPKKGMIFLFSVALCLEDMGLYFWILFIEKGDLKFKQKESPKLEISFISTMNFKVHENIAFICYISAMYDRGIC